MSDPAVPSATRYLRAATSADHADVDAAFSRHDPSTRDGYAAMLVAHARALPSAERWLGEQGGVPAWRARAGLLADDLAALGVAMPEPLHFAPGDHPAAAWGVLYVLEGSRLGNAYLARGIPAGLPHAYMAASHRSGEWRTLLAAFDAAAAPEPAAWLDAATQAAHATFAHYRRAA